MSEGQSENKNINAAEQNLSKEELAKLRKERKEQKEKEKLAKKEKGSGRGRAVEQVSHNLTWEDVKEKNFGVYPLFQSAFKYSDDNNTNNVLGVSYTPISSLDGNKVNENVWLRARIHTSRAKSNKLAFLLLRDGVHSVQCVLAETEQVSRDLVKFAAGLPKETIVDILGTVNAAEKKVESASQQDVEIFVTKIFVLSNAAPKLPLLIEDAMRPVSKDDTGEEVDEHEEHVAHTEEAGEKKAIRVQTKTRLDNRVLDLRAPAHQAIFKLQSAVQQLFREYLYSKDFTEIHTPKMIGTASEGGANIFTVKYFNGNAFLAQSPQLYKQMAIEGDLPRVFEVGPVFRAENSNTHRHLTEFIGLDIEMRIQNHYHEVLDVLSELFIYIFDGIKNRFNHLVEVISQQYQIEPIVYSNPSLLLTYSEGIKMLQEAGVNITDNEDLSTESEKFLGKLVKEKYNTDFYMLDKYPQIARPFYTMPDPNNAQFSNSYDCFIRGEEVLSGAQRIHDADLLTKRARELNIDTRPLEPYIESFRYGAWPHGGAGIGLERLVMLYLGIGNVRRASMFPRDPKRLYP